MSGAKGKKYAKKMRNQPSSVTFPSTDFGQNSGGSSSQDRTQRGNEGDPQYQWQGKETPAGITAVFRVKSRTSHYTGGTK